MEPEEAIAVCIVAGVKAAEKCYGKSLIPEPYDELVLLAAEAAAGRMREIMIRESLRDGD